MHLDFETLLSELSALLSDDPSPEPGRGITPALELIRHSLGIDCCGFMEVHAGRKQIRMTNVSRGEESEGLGLIMPIINGFPWVYRRLVDQDSLIAFSSLENLPPEANGERDFWENAGIEALLMIPLHFQGEVTHLLGLANSRIGPEWPETLPRRLRLLGEMIAKAIISPV